MRYAVIDIDPGTVGIRSLTAHSGERKKPRREKRKKSGDYLTRENKMSREREKEGEVRFKRKRRRKR